MTVLPSQMAPPAHTVLTSTGVTAVVAGCGALLVVWLARRRPAYAALAAPFVVVLSLTAGVSTAAATMLIPEDNRTVTFVLVAGAPLALIVGLVLARRIAAMEASAAKVTADAEAARAVETRRRELVSWMSHDLRTPMAGIRAVAEASTVGAMDPKEAGERIIRNIDSMSAMVDDVFAMSQLQSGAAVCIETVSLIDVVSDAIAAMEPLADAGGVRLSGDVPAGERDLTVRVSPSQIVRAVTNLLDNAVRHTPAGGGVSAELATKDRQARLTIRDGCGGLSEAALAHATDPGWREDTSRGTRRGTGLGLAIVRAVAESHGGSLMVANLPDGSGCTMSLQLPLADEPRPVTGGVLTGM